MKSLKLEITSKASKATSHTLRAIAILQDGRVYRYETHFGGGVKELSATEMARPIGEAIASFIKEEKVIDENTIS